MSLQSVTDLLGLIFFWTRWLGVFFSWLRSRLRRTPSTVLNNKLIATLKCESMVTPRPFDPVGLSVSGDGTIAVVSGPHHAVKLLGSFKF